MIVYCYRSGHIGFAKYKRQVPDGGVIPLASGSIKHCIKAVAQTARLSRVDNKTFFVPGIPEAGCDNEKALEATGEYAVTLRDRLASLRNGPDLGPRYGVVAA